MNGDRKAISKAISLVENREEGYEDLLAALYPRTGRAFIIGVTGPPGTGKSTLVDQMVRLFRAQNLQVAVIAIDPTSPVSGGAILGDRVRMLDHALDQGVYIRSMASRGDEGGLSRGAKNSVRILDAAGNDIVIVETVGTGQAEVEIVKVADVIVVVLMPELGDEIQAIKAGLMEIGDIFVVNKSDLPGADRVIYDIDAILSEKHSGWKQIAMAVSSKTGKGLGALVESLKDYRNLQNSNATLAQRKERLKEEVIEAAVFSLAQTARKSISSDPELESLLERVGKRELDPEGAARLLSGEHARRLAANEVQREEK
jgi:LAO/AO transport system kinase